MNHQPSALSTFLRAASAGEKPAPPPEVRETQRKYGFGGKLPKAVTLSLLAAFALGVVTPPSAEAATVRRNSDPAVITQTAEKPAPITRTQNKDEVMERVNSYKPLTAPEGCVVNSLLFEDWFKQNVPGAWAQQALVEVRIGTGATKKTHHRVVLFQAGKSYFVYDQTYGALPLHDSKANPGDVAAMTESARFVCEAALTNEYNSRNLGTQPARVDREKVKGDIYTAAQKRLAEHRPAAVVEYAGKRSLAFREADKIAVYSTSFGTRQGRLLMAPQAEVALTQMMGALFGGDGKYKIAAGDIAPESRVKDESIAMHQLPHVNVLEVANSSPAPLTVAMNL